MADIYLFESWAGSDIALHDVEQPRSHAVAVIGWSEAPESLTATGAVRVPVAASAAAIGWAEAAEGIACAVTVATPEFVRAPRGRAHGWHRRNAERGRARVLIEPVEMAVSMEDARNHAKINGIDRDSEVEIEVRGLTADAEHRTGRSIIDRTYQVTFDRFPEAIALPSTPLSAVASVEFFDQDGVLRKLHPADVIVDDPDGRPVIGPGFGLDWPATQDRFNAVTVTVVCGYGPDHTTTPPAFKRYILARLREVFAPPGTPESQHLIRALDSMVVY